MKRLFHITIDILTIATNWTSMKKIGEEDR